MASAHITRLSTARVMTFFTRLALVWVLISLVSTTARSQDNQSQDSQLLLFGEPLVSTAEVRSAFGESPVLHSFGFRLAIATGDFEAAASYIDRLRADPEFDLDRIPVESELEYPESIPVEGRTRFLAADVLNFLIPLRADCRVGSARALTAFRTGEEGSRNESASVFCGDSEVSVVSATLTASSELTRVVVPSLLVLSGGSSVFTVRLAGSPETTLYAASIGARALEYVLDLGARVDQKDARGNSGLFFAGSPEVVEILLAAGLSPNEPNAAGARPLDVAADDGKAEIVNALLIAGADPDRLDSLDQSALHRAVARGDLAVVKALAGIADVNTVDVSGETPLISSVKAGNEAVVRQLVSTAGRRLDLEATDADGVSALTHAVSEGNGSLNELLLNAGATASPAALLASSAAAESAIAIRLIEAGADVNATGPDGVTALHFAARNGSQALVEALVDRGVSIGSRTVDGKTALLSAASSGHTEIVQRLLGAGAQINERDAAGNTSLILASEGGHPTLTRWLLRNGAARRAKNDQGETASRIAANSRVKRLFKYTKPFSFAFLMTGANLTRVVDDQHASSVGFDFGISAKLRFAPKLAVRADASFSIRVSDVDESTGPVAFPSQGDFFYRMDHVNVFPMLEYTFGSGYGANPYVMLGGGFRQLLNAELKDWSDNTEPEDVTELSDEIAYTINGGLGIRTMMPGGTLVYLELQYARATPGVLDEFDAAVDSFGLVLGLGR